MWNNPWFLRDKYCYFDICTRVSRTGAVRPQLKQKMSWLWRHRQLNGVNGHNFSTLWVPRLRFRAPNIQKIKLPAKKHGALQRTAPSNYSTNLMNVLKNYPFPFACSKKTYAFDLNFSGGNLVAGKEHGRKINLKQVFLWKRNPWHVAGAQPQLPLCACAIPSSWKTALGSPGAPQKWEHVGAEGRMSAETWMWCYKWRGELGQALPLTQISGSSSVWVPQIVLIHKVLIMADEVYCKINYLLKRHKCDRHKTLNRLLTG